MSTLTISKESERLISAVERGSYNMTEQARRSEALRKHVASLERELEIRSAQLTLPDDLLSLRNALDLGHNIGRADAYALVNHIERLQPISGGTA